jgi:16S rRNA (guanine527-N7)-methyltransferase
MQQRLQQLLEQVGIELTPQQLAQQVALVEQLHKWNKAYNLTSVRDPQQMLSRHIVDSLVVLPLLHGTRFIDVGTGPGLPGLPLAIARPDWHFVLLDSLGKRIRFIRQVCHLLNITNVTAVQSRVEDYHDQQQFDGVISRAFASLNDMLSWCQHLPNADGCFYALKGQYPSAELAALDSAYEVNAVTKLQVPEAEGERHLVTIKTRG